MNGDTRDLMPEYQPAARGGQGGPRMPSPPDACSLAEEARRAVAAVASLSHVLPTPPPPANGRTPLLSSVVGPGRYEAFFPVLRRWFDLDDPGLTAVFGRIEAGRSWIDAPFPGVRYFHFQAEKGMEKARESLIRICRQLLFDRFGSLTPSVSQQLSEMPLDRLEAVVGQIYRVDSVEAVFAADQSSAT